MIRTIIIALLLWQTAFAQMTVGQLHGNRTFTPSNPYTGLTSTPTYTQGFYVFIVFSRYTSTPSVPTISNASFGWEQVMTITGKGSTGQIFRMTAWVTNITSPITEYTYVTFPENPTWVWHSCIRFTSSNGAKMILRQTVTKQEDGGGTTPSIEMAGLKGSNNATLMMYVNSLNSDATGTAPAGWTESQDWGGPSGFGGYRMYRANHADNVPTVTHTSAVGDWFGAAFEVIAGRRVIID